MSHDHATDLDQFHRVVADRVRTVRVWRNLTQEQLAHAAGVSPRSVTGVESGRTGVLLDKLFLLARALDVSVADLVRELDASASQSGEV